MDPLPLPVSSITLPSSTPNPLPLYPRISNGSTSTPSLSAPSQPSPTLPPPSAPAPPLTSAAAAVVVEAQQSNGGNEASFVCYSCLPNPSSTFPSDQALASHRLLIHCTSASVRTVGGEITAHRSKGRNVLVCGVCRKKEFKGSDKWAEHVLRCVKRATKREGGGGGKGGGVRVVRKDVVLFQEPPQISSAHPVPPELFAHSPMASLSTSTSNSSSPSSMPSRLQAPILPPTTTSPFSASPLSKPNGLLDHVLQRPRSASRLNSNGGTPVPAAAAIPSPPESSSSSFESMRQTNELYSRDLASLLGLTQSLHENLSLPQQTQQHLQSLLTQSESLRHTNNELLGSKVLFLRSQLKPLQTQLAQLQSDLERAQTESHQAASKVEKEWKMKLKRAEVAVEEERKLRVGWEERLGGWEVRVLELEREVEGLRGEVEKEREEKKTMAGTEEEKERERAKLERENEQLRRRVGELELAALNPRRESLPPPSHTHTSSTLNPLKRSATPAPNDDSPANSPAKHRRLTETARSETPGASGTGSTTTGSTGSRSPSAEPGNAGKSMDKKYTGGMPAVEEREGRLDFLTFWTKTTVKPNKKDGGRRTCTLCARDKSLPSPPTPTPYPANTPLDDLVAHLEAKHAQLWAIITGPGGVDGNKKRKGAVVAGGV